MLREWFFQLLEAKLWALLGHSCGGRLQGDGHNLGPGDRSDGRHGGLHHDRVLRLHRRMPQGCYSVAYLKLFIYQHEAFEHISCFNWDKVSATMTGHNEQLLSKFLLTSVSFNQQVRISSSTTVGPLSLYVCTKVLQWKKSGRRWYQPSCCHSSASSPRLRPCALFPSASKSRSSSRGSRRVPSTTPETSWPTLSW